MIWKGTKLLGFIVGLGLVPYGIWYWCNVTPEGGLTIVISGLSVLISTATFHVNDKTRAIYKRLDNDL